MGNEQATRGQGYVVYNDESVAAAALSVLNGFRVGGRYIVVSYFAPQLAQRKPMTQDELQKRREELEALKEKYGLDDEGNALDE